MSNHIPLLSDPTPLDQPLDTGNDNSSRKRFALLSVLIGLGFLGLMRPVVPASRSEEALQAPNTIMASLPRSAMKLNIPSSAYLFRPARHQVRASYTPDQLEFMKRKEMETGMAGSSVAVADRHDTSKYSPDQLAFLKRQEIDYNAVRADIKKIMDDPDWDDGSYGPLLIRLGWHSSGTYSEKTATGGSNGAAMRFAHGTEAKDPENAGLAHAQAYLQQIKDKYPLMSHSDMWILAAYVAIEHMGGPTIEFKPGRTDAPNERKCPEWDGPPIDGKSSSRLPHAEYGLVEGFDRNKVLDSEGRIKGWENLAQHLRDTFYRMGFNDREIVALMTGGHLWGRCHPEHSGYAGPWVEEMTKWSNEYAADMIEDDWRMVTNDDTWLDDIGAEELRPAPGKRQYVNKFPPWEKTPDPDEPNQMMLPADMVLLWDPEFKKTLQEYAVDNTGTDDNTVLRRDFAAAYKKLTELGTSNLKACPFAH